jgi:hypothetical protein
VSDLNLIERAFWGGLTHHTDDECHGAPCPIHHPTDHQMRSWPLHWRADRGILERTCTHGIGHPDPDQTLSDGGIHGCDGCCHTPPNPTTTLKENR